ncbi:MAG: class I SAM-dependent methyltransferase, partial [Methylocystis sp.]|nr:class I SAM-dependent methyltransferase [Methylocystis sp.]
MNVTSAANAPERPAQPLEQPRLDLAVIAEMVAPGARVLDVGCGDGALLKLLAQKKGVDGRGVEL